MKKRVITFILLLCFSSTVITRTYVSAEELSEETSEELSAEIEDGPDDTEEEIDYESEMGEIGEYDVVNCPNYFQQDYSTIAFGDKTLAECGNLATCLASMETFYLSQDVTPETFVGIHTDDCLQGVKTLNVNSIDKYAKYFGTALIKDKFDYETIAEYVKRYNAKVLVRIPHKSALGNNSTYIVITGITKDGFYVVDPNKENLKYATKTEDGYVYDVLFITIVCSKSADMFIFY